MNIKKYIKKNTILLIILTVILIIGAVLLMLVGNQINFQKTQIANLQRTVELDNLRVAGAERKVVDMEYGVTKDNPNPILKMMEQSSVSPTPSSVDPHAGMKEVKGMNCQPAGGNGALNCTESDYWYTPSTGGSNSGVGVPHPIQY
jgi:hypothetical protein